MSSSTPASRRWLSIGGLILAAIIFVAIVIGSNLGINSARLDLTEEKLFTLSSGSIAMVEDIEEPIHLRLFVSDNLSREIPSIGLYAQRVRDLLEEYEAVSDGMIDLEVLNPEPFSNVEDQAVAAGLQGVPLDQGGELVYFGLVGTNATDSREVIPFFDQSREPFLEYDISRALYRLVHPERPKVGVLTSLPIAGTPYAQQSGQDDSWMIWSQLQELFEVDMISADEGGIPEDIDLLVLIHPKDLSEATLYAIDQYTLRGGKLLTFVDPHSEADQSYPARPGQQKNVNSVTTLEPLFESWGIQVPADTVVGDLASARRVQVPSDSESRVAGVDYPLWMALTPSNFDQDDLITAELGQMNIASPGEIVQRDGSDVTVQPLIRTSASSGRVGTDRLAGRADPVGILNTFEPLDEQLTLAARISGTLDSAFDGPPEGFQTPEGFEHLATSNQSANMILVADVDMLADGLWVRVQDFFGQRVAVPYASNGTFFINAADNMTGSGDLIGLRSRGVLQRPFDKIQEIQREAEQGFRAKEQELLATLSEAEERLRSLQNEDAGGQNMVLTDQQRQEMERFRTRVLETRQELRDVQHALRSDVQNLKSWLTWANILLMPVLVALVAVVLALVRRSSRRSARRHAAAG